MQTYIIRRLILMIPTVFLATAFIFLLVRFIPGTQVDLLMQMMAGEGFAQGEDITIAELKHRLGLDIPIHIQSYAGWERLSRVTWVNPHGHKSPLPMS